MIVLLAQYQAKDGQGDAVAAALTEMATLVREHESGCAMYQVSRKQDDANSFILYEQYVDQAAVDAHRETAHFQKYVLDAIVPMLDTRVAAFYDRIIE